MCDYKKIIFNLLKENTPAFVIGIVVGGVIFYLIFDNVGKDIYFTAKEVSKNYVPKEEFRELQKKYEDSQKHQSQIYQAKTNTSKLKNCQTTNNGLSKSLQQAKNRIKKLNDVEKIKVEKDKLWRKYHSFDNNWGVNFKLSPTEKSEKKESFKNQIDQLQRDIELKLKCL